MEGYQILSLSILLALAVYIGQASALANIAYKKGRDHNEWLVMGLIPFLNCVAWVVAPLMRPDHIELHRRESQQPVRPLFYEQSDSEKKEYMAQPTRLAEIIRQEKISA